MYDECFGSKKCSVFFFSKERNQEPGASSGSPVWVAMIQALGPLPQLFPYAITGSWGRAEAIRTWSSTYVDSVIMGGGFICYAIMPASVLCLISIFFVGCLYLVYFKNQSGGLTWWLKCCLRYQCPGLEDLDLILGSSPNSSFWIMCTLGASTGWLLCSCHPHGRPKLSS